LKFPGIAQRTLVLGLGAIRANYVLLVSDKSLPDQTLLAHRAQETFVMPVSILKRNEFGAAATLPDDRLSASRAAFSKELSVTAGAVGLVLLYGKLLTGQLGATVGAQKAFLVERLALVRDTVCGDDLSAFGASKGKLVFVAASAINFVVFRNEGPGTDSMFARNANEALFMPLSALVFKFFSSRSKYFATAVAFLSK